MVPTTLDYSTFLGGSLTDSAFAVAADAAGNTYLTGMTASENFPVTPGAFDGSLNGVYDAFVAKFRSDGTLAWSTYLGGDGDERGHGIAVDTRGNVYIVGRTDSANYPTTSGSFDTTFNGGVDAFVTKLNPDGATLAYSTYVGGSGFEIDQGFDKLARRVGAIALDAVGQAYVTGSTMSGDFPTTAGAFRTVSAGLMDAFVVKLNDAGTALLYSTFLGGDDNDRGHGIGVDADGNAYVMGEVLSANFPTTAGAFQPAMSGGFSDAFVTKLSAAGSALIYSSYLGGTQAEIPGRLTLDTAGQAYVTGSTDSFDFPTTAGAFQTARATNGFDAFVTKINQAGSALVYSTYLGGSFGNESGEWIAVDANGQAYITGQTFSGEFPMANAFQSLRSGDSDAFVTKLNASGSALVSSSYLGGGRDEIGYGIAVSGGNVVHLVGHTNSSGAFSRPALPTTGGAFQTTFGGITDAFVARLSVEDGSSPLPSLYIADVSSAEGHGGSRLFQFTVGLTSAGNLPVTFAYATADGTATAGIDYQAASGKLTIPSGQVTGTITVIVNGDRQAELNETFFVNLTGATNATIIDGEGVATVRDDEPHISISDFAKPEGNGHSKLFAFTITLSTAYDQPVTMSYRTVNGTAETGDNDYVRKTGTLTFKPGERTKTITIVVNGDSKKEGHEAFFVDLFGNSSNSLFIKNRGKGSIMNDDER